jgi:hypothetical protein
MQLVLDVLLSTLVNETCNNVCSKFSGTGGVDLAALMRPVFDAELDNFATPLSGGGPKDDDAFNTRYVALSIYT